MKRILLFMIIVLACVSATEAITKEAAEHALQNAEKDIAEMKEKGFGTEKVDDLLVQAKGAFDRAGFADLVKYDVGGGVATEAKKALEGLNYEGFSYDDVLKYTDEIFGVKQKAFEIDDSFSLLVMNIDEYSGQGVETQQAQQLYDEAKDAFVNERYTESEEALNAAYAMLEEKRAELTQLNIALRSSRGFIEKNWKSMLALFAVVALISVIVVKKTKLRNLKKHIHKLEIEEKALMKLMKRAQVERYHHGTIPKIMYDIRMGSYNKRLNGVKEELPVAKARLKRMEKAKKTTEKKDEMKKRKEEKQKAVEKRKAEMKKKLAEKRAKLKDIHKKIKERKKVLGKKIIQKKLTKKARKKPKKRILHKASKK